MTEITQNFMNQIWEARNNGADTEEKLVSAIIQIALQSVPSYITQDGRTVLDLKDLLKLSEELQND